MLQGLALKSKKKRKEGRREGGKKGRKEGRKEETPKQSMDIDWEIFRVFVCLFVVF